MNTLVNSHSPYQALTNMGAHIIGYAAGCTRNETQLAALDCPTENGFMDASKLAAKADVAVVFVGLQPSPSSAQDPNGAAGEGETWDRINLELPGHQEDLILEVLSANPKTVVVLIHGGPLAIPRTKDQVPAILDAHYPGEVGGDAIANILYGNISPAGRLTTTIYPASFIQRNITNMDLRDDGGVTYKYYTGDPLWEFGFGLSYSTFKMTPITTHVDVTTQAMADYFPHRFDSEDSAPSIPIVYTVNVTNTGSVPSDFVALGFLNNPSPGMKKALFDFARVHISPGQSTIVHFSMPPQILARVNDAGEQLLHPGNYTVSFGVEGSSEGTPTTSMLTVTGSPQTIFSFAEIKKRSQSNNHIK